MALTEDGVVDFLEDSIKTSRRGIAVSSHAVRLDGLGA
jgi:hypothetical protein